MKPSVDPAELTDRERALLAAWDERHPPPPDRAFEARLVLAYTEADEADEASWQTDEACHRAACARMADDAEGRCLPSQSVQSNDAACASFDAPGDWTEIARAALETPPDELGPRRRARRWVYPAAAAVALAAVVAAAQWPVGVEPGPPLAITVGAPRSTQPRTFPAALGASQGITPREPPDAAVTIDGAALVATVITASPEVATVEIIDTDQAGPAPFTAWLERGKSYKARLGARGFAVLEFDLRGGDGDVRATLAARPRVLAIRSEPPGALISLDGNVTGHVTPFDIELDPAQAAEASVRVELRKTGYDTVERVFDFDKVSDLDPRMTPQLDVTLTVTRSQAPGHARSNSAAPP